MAGLPKNLRPSYSRSLGAYVRARFNGGVALKNPIRSTTSAKLGVPHIGYSRMRTGR